jgi:hypothetical protein
MTRQWSLTNSAGQDSLMPFRCKGLPSKRGSLKMMKCFLDASIFLAVTLAMAGQCQAAKASTRTALIIGIGVYGSPDIPVLLGVKEDMKSALAISKAMGIPEANIRVLRDEQASKAGILDALRELGEATSDGARTFVYYSGHGTRWQDPQAGGCVEGLLTYDYKVITNAEIAAITKKLSDKADKFMSMFDACHSAGVAPKLTARSIGEASFSPKFYMKSGAGTNACSQPSNLRARGLLGESTRLGALPENFVQITSSLSTEVSFDEPGKGGVATQAVRDCLLGKASDLDASGAVSMAEVQQCAQQIIDQKLRNTIDVTPHHVTVSGNRNLIPVQRPKPPVESPVPQAVALAPVVQTPAPVPVQQPAPPPAQAAPVRPPPPPSSPLPVAAPVLVNAPVPAPTPPTVAAPAAPIRPVPTPTPPPPVKPPKPEPALASRATLKDIEQQRNPKRVVSVTLSKSSLKIGKDEIDFKVTSNHDGYVYLVMLGSDAKSFYILFPNGLDGDNYIRAGKALRLPKPDWAVKAAGPAGTDQLLVMVSDAPRKLDGLTLAEPTATVPFTYALNTLGGRSALIDFLTGSGIDGKSESFGAKLLSLKEVP